MYHQEENNETIRQAGEDLLLHDVPYLLKNDYAGFWLRFAAYVIDIIACWAFIFVGGLIFGAGLGSNPYDAENISAGYWILMGLIYVLLFLYFPLLESSQWQATLGKRAVGIKVSDMQGNRIGFGRAVGRTLSKIVSAIILYIGFFMAGFTEKKQALHDIIAGTLVVKQRA